MFDPGIEPKYCSVETCIRITRGPLEESCACHALGIDAVRVCVYVMCVCVCALSLIDSGRYSTPFPFGGTRYYSGAPQNRPHRQACVSYTYSANLPTLRKDYKYGLVVVTGISLYMHIHSGLVCHVRHLTAPSTAVAHQVEGELEYRLRQKAALQTMLKEKMLELDRQNLQYKSLLRIESEQLALIERLSNSETLTEQAPHK